MKSFTFVKTMIIMFVVLSTIGMVSCISPQKEAEMFSNTTVYNNIDDYINDFYERFPEITVEKGAIKKKISDFRNMDTRGNTNPKFLADCKEHLMDIFYYDGIESKIIMAEPKYDLVENYIDIYVKSGIILTSKENSDDVVLKYYQENISTGQTIYKRVAEIAFENESVIVTEIEQDVDITDDILFHVDIRLFYIIFGSDEENDDDGDGVPNWLEWLAGTDPNDPNDYPDWDGDSGNDGGGNGDDSDGDGEPDVSFDDSDDISDDPNDDEFYENGGFWEYFGNGIWVYINGNGETVGWYNEYTGDYDGNIDDDLFNGGF
jgi:hypothetical protein